MKSWIIIDRVIIRFWVFLNDTVAIGMKQLFQVIDLFTQFGAFVGVGYQHTVGRHLYNLGS